MKFVTNSSLLVEYKKAEELYESDRTTESIEIFSSLSQRGLPEATRFLAFILMTGDGVPVDEIGARRLYNESLEQLKSMSDNGNGAASLLLGKIYQYGDKIEEDPQKAVSYLLKAVAQGNPEAMLKVAHIKRFGWCGLPASYTEYLSYLELAVEKGEPEALFEKGLSVKGDNEANGLHLIRKASELGFSPATEFLEGLNGQET